MKKTSKAARIKKLAKAKASKEQKVTQSNTEPLPVIQWSLYPFAGTIETVGRKIALLEALERTYGIVVPACALANVHRKTYWEWKKEDPAFAEAVKDVAYAKKDFAEYQLFRLASQGVVQAVMEINKKINRDRGYGDKLEVFQGAGLSNKKTLQIPDNGRNSKSPAQLPLEIRATVIEEGVIVSEDNIQRPMSATG